MQYPRLRVSAMLALCKLMAIDAEFWCDSLPPVTNPVTGQTVFKAGPEGVKSGMFSFAPMTEFDDFHTAFLLSLRMLLYPAH